MQRSWEENKLSVFKEKDSCDCSMAAKRGRMIEGAASKIGIGQVMWGIWGLSVCQGNGEPLYDVMYGGEMIQCAFLNAH